MALIHSKFDFVNKPWWRPDYDNRAPQYFISSTKRFQQAILLSVNNEDELLWKGFMDLHRERYLIECISAEGNVDLDVIKQLLKKSRFEVFLNYACRIFFPRIIFGSSRSSHLAKKVQNLHDTINGIFPTIFFPNLPMDRFTPLLAQQLHQQIGNGLIDNAGQYRTRYVMAAQENYVYLAPNLIENRIEELFRQCREKFGKEELELDEAIKFGACFLTHFLYIHPFMNGNGRVARVLLSYLLSKFTVVPLSLYTGTRTRDLYLQCLRESRYHEPFLPNALATFILENVYMTSYNICTVMDIDISE
ncbi:5645_t:CDS:1 [Ambispora leptoticha]|uniref:5645_t:CDS:1 n=1 Tax=Ambispora leptoticha TaxID=144679 RepID=A0A9N9ECY8_9GLOM|nr:5645_t:CDS:1 [Ambispora leptoticha]